MGKADGRRARTIAESEVSMPLGAVTARTSPGAPEAASSAGAEQARAEQQQVRASSSSSTHDTGPMPRRGRDASLEE